MSIKDLFYSKDSYKVATSSSLEQLGSTVESDDFIEQHNIEEKRFVPVVDFSKPENFVKFGSAEEYYVKNIQN